MERWRKRKRPHLHYNTKGISGGAVVLCGIQDDERWGVGKWHFYIHTVCNVWLLYCIVQKQVLRFPRCRKFLKHSCSTKHAPALLFIWGSLRIRGFRILIWRYVQPRQLITSSSAQLAIYMMLFFRFGFASVFPILLCLILLNPQRHRWSGAPTNPRPTLGTPHVLEVLTMYCPLQ